jgi:ATP-dependent DNA helicase RecG
MPAADNLTPANNAAPAAVPNTAPAATPTTLGLLLTPVTSLRGVAGKRAALLQRLGIQSWYDLISWYPRSFEDWSETTALTDLQDGEDQTFVATVSAKVSAHRKGRLTVLRTVLRADDGAIAAVWFNQPWVADRLVKDTAYRFRGRVKRRDGQLTVQNPSFEIFEELSRGTVRAVYPLTEGLSQGILRQLIQSVLPQVVGLMPEPLPAWVRREHHLCAVDFAISRIHQPASLEEAEICRRRLAFEELFLVQAGLYLLRRQRQQDQAGYPW